MAAAIGTNVLIFGLIFFFILPLALLATAFWIWMIISAVQNKGIDEGEKIAWVLVVIFLPFLGAVLYFFLGKSKGRGIGD